jgi:predicted nuclease of predicted toxin-antitoxin system
LKIKLDENIPETVAVLLNGSHEVDTVRSEGLAGEPDADVWAAAQREARFLITQDLDFSDIRKFAPGTHAGILLIRLREPSRGALFLKVGELRDLYDLETWAGCFVVATELKTRILRPS